MPINQQDREAAARIYDGLHSYGCSKTAHMAEDIRLGRIDDNLAVMECARLRQAALIEGIKLGLEAAKVLVLREHKYHQTDSLMDISARVTCDDIEANISRLDPTTIAGGE